MCFVASLLSLLLAIKPHHVLFLHSFGPITFPMWSSTSVAILALCLIGPQSCADKCLGMFCDWTRAHQPSQHFISRLWELKRTVFAKEGM